jgi:hypothetical protein
VMGDATILVRALAFLCRGLSFFTAMAFSDFAMVFEPIGEACREFLSSGGLATWDGLGLQKPRLPAITGRHSSIERYLQSQSTSPSPHGFTAHHLAEFELVPEKFMPPCAKAVGGATIRAVIRIPGIVSFM